MRKSISIILAGICIVGLVGCGANKNVNTKATKNTSVEQKQNTNQNNKSQEQENNDEKTSTSPLIGKWSTVQNSSEMELTEDGKLLDAGTEVATYEIINESTVKISTPNEEEVEITYEIDGDTLKWGTNLEEAQEFTKVVPVTPVG